MAGIRSFKAGKKLLHKPEQLFALVAFVHTKRGRKLLKRVARTPEERELIRSIKKQPGGKRVLKAVELGEAAQRNLERAS